MLVTNLLIRFLLLSSPNPENLSIYIAKIDWHVGIILAVNDNLITQINVVKQFEEYDYVDVGWGDAEFYQSPGEFDLYLAAKAILLPTPSVLRFQGYKRTIEEIINWRDYVFRIEVDSSQYIRLCGFIAKSFSKDSTNQNIITSEKYSGNVKFYASVHKYHAVNTCNTWVAEALEFSGLPVRAADIITAEELFIELAKFATIIKSEIKK